MSLKRQMRLVEMRAFRIPGPSRSLRASCAFAILVHPCTSPEGEGSKYRPSVPIEEQSMMR